MEALPHGSCKLLSEKQLVDLIMKYQRHPTIKREHQIILALAPFALMMAKRFVTSIMDMDHCIELALYGLWDGVRRKKYDPKKGKPTTHYQWWIQRTIREWNDCEREVIRIPRWGMTRKAQASKEPSTIRCLERRERIKRGLVSLSFRNQFHNLQLESSDAPLSKSLILKEEREQLPEALKCLSLREQSIVWRRANGQTLKAISELWQISRERVRQIERRALEKLRCWYEKDGV